MSKLKKYKAKTSKQTKQTQMSNVICQMKLEQLRWDYLMVMITCWKETE